MPRINFCASLVLVDGFLLFVKSVFRAKPATRNDAAAKIAGMAVEHV